MDSPARRLILPFLLAASMAHVAFGQTPARDSLGAARDLYASARYDEALAVLNDLRPNDNPGTTTDLKSIEQYRSLCLLALGRGSEAETAIAAVVTADPNYLPGDSEASPRVRAAFSDVRKRLLPEIASSRYAEAKTIFDRKEYARAAAAFKQVLLLLDDPDMGGKLSDLRTLAAGFLDLAVAATPPPEPPKPAPAPAPEPAPAAPQPEPNRIYTMNDADVVAPVIIRQDLPRLTPIMKPQARDHGIVEVVIDELGRVISIAVRQSIQPMYDAELLTRGREWRYQPAMLNGKPVRYRKMIQLNINKDYLYEGLRPRLPDTFRSPLRRLAPIRAHFAAARSLASVGRIAPAAIRPASIPLRWMTRSLRSTPVCVPLPTRGRRRGGGPRRWSGPDPRGPAGAHRRRSGPVRPTNPSSRRSCSAS